MSLIETVCCAIVVLLVLEAVDAVDITLLNKREAQDRQLIAGLEANYATNADFRRLDK